MEQDLKKMISSFTPLDANEFWHEMLVTATYVWAREHPKGMEVTKGKEEKEFGEWFKKIFNSGTDSKWDKMFFTYINKYAENIKSFFNVKRCANQLIDEEKKNFLILCSMRLFLRFKI